MSVDMVAAITFTHPVPLLILLGYSAAVLGLGRLGSPGRSATDIPRPTRGDWMILAAAGASLGYVSRFRTPGGLFPDQVPVNAVQGFGLHWLRVQDFVKMFLVSPIILRPYRYGLAGVLLVALVAGMVIIAHNLVRGCRTTAAVALGWGLLLALGIAFLPTWVNGSALFAERLALPCVIMLMVAASGWNRIRTHSLVMAGGALWALLALALLQTVIGPAARRVALPERKPAIAPDNRALFITTLNTPVGLTFDPCRSAGVRLIQQGRGIWMNPAWLGSPQLMLGYRHNPVPVPEMLAKDSGLSVVIGHCGGPDGGLTAGLENTYPGRWTVTRYFWANVLVPIARPVNP